jgi:imidazolonepropionase-like amidohydrolase
LKNESWKNSKYLIESGVKFSIMSDHPVSLQRNLFLQLRFLRRYGLNRAQCISKITKEPAEILGIDKDLGSLKKGHLASFVCWNGDPFSLDSHPTSVFAEGKLIHGNL